MRTESEKTVHIITWIWFIPFAAAAVLLLGVSFCTRVYYDFNQQVDLPRFGKENLLLLMALLILFFLGLFLLKQRTGFLSGESIDGAVPGRPVPLEKSMKILLTAVTVLCLYFILSMRGIATSDAMMLDGIINQFMQGNFSALTTGGYLYANPHQLGYVAIGQLLYLLFGSSNYMVFQLLNIPAILVTLWVLYQITWELYENREFCRLEVILSSGLFCLFCYATFVYNDIWSMAPEMMALYLTFRYLKYHRVKDMAAGSILFGAAVVLKTNCWIALIAASVILVLDGLKNNTALKQDKRKIPFLLQNILLVLLLVILGKGMTGILDAAYGKAAGIDPMPRGNANSTYIAMGMQENGGEGGWYNGYNANTFSENGFDTERTDQDARNYIAGRLAEFRKRPLHAAHFYVRKFLSQWADESCISLHNMEQTSRHVTGQPAIMYYYLYGTGRRILRWIMNVYQTLLFLGVTIWCAGCIKRRRLNFLSAFAVLYIFGGMVFHELWEASSRYILRYYVFMLPLAVKGIADILEMQGRHSGKQKRRSSD
jgi:hypothetical protein